MSSTPPVPSSPLALSGDSPAELQIDPASEVPVVEAAAADAAPHDSAAEAAADADAQSQAEVGAESVESAAAVDEAPAAMDSTEQAATPATPDAAQPRRVDMPPAQVAQALRERFPALFTGITKPLKLRIQVDIQERAPGVFPRQALSAFFRRYTGGHGYLVAITRAPHRFDLDGKPAGEISDEHRKVAAEELTRRRSLHENRQAEEAAQRERRLGLLRDFEKTTLSRPNFCALKGVDDAALDDLLALARKELAEAPPREAFPDRGPRGPRRDGPGAGPGRGPGRDDGRPRGDRSDRGPRPTGPIGPRDATPRRADGERGPSGPRNDNGPRPPRGPGRPR